MFSSPFCWQCPDFLQALFRSKHDLINKLKAGTTWYNLSRLYQLLTFDRRDTSSPQESGLADLAEVRETICLPRWFNRVLMTSDIIRYFRYDVFPWIFNDFHRLFRSHADCCRVQEVDIAMRASQLAKGFARNVQQACQEPKEPREMLGEQQMGTADVDRFRCFSW